MSEQTITVLARLLTKTVHQRTHFGTNLVVPVHVIQKEIEKLTTPKPETRKAE